MQFTLLAALSRNGVIGNEGKLPWRSKADMERFAQLTAGKPIIMGRKTWESLPKQPLPGRLNVVISSQQLSLPSGCHLFNSFDQAILQLHRAFPENHNTAFIIGGAEIYNQALEKCVPSKMLLTYIESYDIVGDTFFDPFKFTHPWKIQNTWEKKKGEGEEYDITFVNYEKEKLIPRKKFVQRGPKHQDDSTTTR